MTTTDPADTNDPTAQVAAVAAILDEVYDPESQLDPNNRRVAARIVAALTPDDDGPDQSLAMALADVDRLTRNLAEARSQLRDVQNNRLRQLREIGHALGCNQYDTAGQIADAAKRLTRDDLAIRRLLREHGTGIGGPGADPLPPVVAEHLAGTRTALDRLTRERDEARAEQNVAVRLLEQSESIDAVMLHRLREGVRAVADEIDETGRKGLEIGEPIGIVMNRWAAALRVLLDGADTPTSPRPPITPEHAAMLDATPAGHSVGGQGNG
jgi:hypothetical protein